MQNLTVIIRQIKSFPNRLQLRADKLILISSLFIAGVYNQTLWLQLVGRVEQNAIFKGLGFAVALLCLHATIIGFAALLFNTKYTLKPFLYSVLLVSACISYFNGLGIVIDDAMITNTLETDKREIIELIYFTLILHFVLYFALPAYFLHKLSVIYPVSPWQYLRSAGLPFTLALLCLVLIYSNYRYATFFGRENTDLKIYLNPSYPIVSVNKYIKKHFVEPPPFIQLGADAHQVKLNKKKTVGIFVVGETARADHFSLNGYPRPTTPLLSSHKLFSRP